MRTGDVLVFDGDLVHAGSAYDEQNDRLHCYVNTYRYLVSVMHLRLHSLLLLS